MEYGMVLACLLFVCGLLGLLIRRNLLVMLMSAEIMLNASGLAFVLGSCLWGHVDGQIMYVFILALAGAEATLGLALAVVFRRQQKTLDTDTMHQMRG
jgi:NADH-quinone oxidoreductase subunit K